MDFLKKLWGASKQKLVYALIALVTESIRIAYPQAPLPPPGLVETLVLGLIAGHTLTDIAHLLAEAIKAWSEAKKA